MKQKLLIIGIIALLTAPFFVHASGLVPCGGPSDDHACSVLDLFYMVARVTNWLILMAGVYAVYQFVNAGFWLVASAGNDENIAKWRKALSNAVVGFFIVMGAYMFMNTAVNMILMSKCAINFQSPWTYLEVSDYSKCTNPSNTFLNSSGQ